MTDLDEEVLASLCAATAGKEHDVGLERVEGARTRKESDAGFVSGGATSQQCDGVCCPSRGRRAPRGCPSAGSQLGVCKGGGGCLGGALSGWR